MFLCTLVGKDEAMGPVLSIDDAIQSVVCETLERTGQADVEAQNGLGMFDELRREFPQATIVTLSLSALLDAVQGSVDTPEQAW